MLSKRHFDCFLSFGKVYYKMNIFYILNFILFSFKEVGVDDVAPIQVQLTE